MLEVVVSILFKLGLSLFGVFAIGLLLAYIISHGYSQRPDKIIREYFAENGFKNITIKASGFYSFQDKVLLKEVENELNNFFTYGSSFIRVQCYKIITEELDTFHVLYHLSRAPFANAKIYLDKELENKN